MMYTVTEDKIANMVKNNHPWILLAFSVVLAVFLYSIYASTNGLYLC